MELPDNEIERLKTLSQYHILDTAPEADFDELTRLAAYICHTPIAAIGLTDGDILYAPNRRFGGSFSVTPAIASDIN